MPGWDEMVRSAFLFYGAVLSCGFVFTAFVGSVLFWIMWTLVKGGNSSSGGSGNGEGDWEEEVTPGWNPMSAFGDFASSAIGVSSIADAREAREERNEAIREQQEWDDYEQYRRER